MLLHNRNSAIAIFLKSATSSPQLESFTSAIYGIFLAVKSSRFLKKKIGGKKSHASVPLQQVFVYQKNKQFKKFLVDF
jgi:hypothetical protein